MELDGLGSVRHLVEANVLSFLDGPKRGIKAFLDRCDSPIAKLLGSAFLRDVCFDGNNLEIAESVSDSGVVNCFFAGSQNVPFTIEANTNIETEIGLLRPDFLFKIREPNSSAFYGRVVFLFGVEVDGHNFHEKTREQVRRDKRRDRSLLSAGVRLLRFSGSEVFHSLDDVLREISDFMFAEARRVGLWDYHTGTVDDWNVRKNMRPLLEPF